MPRLPTMRVIGSQDISTSLRVSVGDALSGKVTVAMTSLPPLAPGVSRGMVSGRQLGSVVPPLRLLVGRGVGEAAQGADHGAVHADGFRGQLGAGGLVHEGHELVGEA